jgi:hypothetical protein
MKLALAALALVACSTDSGTSGKRIRLEAKIGVTPESKEFTNAAGWRVKTTKAVVAVGALYYYDGDTIFASRRFTFIKPAYAHPGHYIPGNAKGEMRTPTSADVLAGATLGTGDGVSGMVRSATFAFAGELGPNAIVLEGTAEKGAELRTFRAEISFDETKGADGRPEVEGCAFTPADMESDGVVRVAIKLPLWFDQVDFEPIPKSDDGKPIVMPAGLARNQLVRGTKAGLGYAFSYEGVSR